VHLFRLGFPAARVIFSPNCSARYPSQAVNKRFTPQAHQPRQAPVDDKVPVNSIEDFRGYAKRLLKAYHGGFNRNLSLFIREGGFR
jgi:hypothetical protein